MNELDVITTDLAKAYDKAIDYCKDLEILTVQGKL